MSFNSTINEVIPKKPNINPTILNPTKPIPTKPIPTVQNISNSIIILKKCGPKKYINPLTGRCVQLNNNTIQQLLKKGGHKLEDGDIVMPIPKVPKVPVPKMSVPKMSVPKMSIPKKNMILSCGPNMYINPKTKRCVQFKNADIQKYLKRGYQLEKPIDLTIDVKKLPMKKTIPSVIPYLKKVVPKAPVPGPAPVPVPVPSPKVLVPNFKNPPIELIFCGPGKVINPETGRCILLKSKIGQKLTSVPYVIVNPPSGPQKQPYIAPVKIDKKSPLTSLDEDGDNYVSVKEYLDSVESIGPKEKSFGFNFSFYNQRDLGIAFILTLIKNKTGPIHKIGCIPKYILCVYKSLDNSGQFKGVYSTAEDTINNNILSCPIGLKDKEYYYGNVVNTYASIAIINAPYNYENLKSNTKVLIPPNLKKQIENCENDGKYMVVCDLTLLSTDDFYKTSHANVLIFDIKRKTVERFDPHGGSKYADTYLKYDPDNSIGDRKDFKFGIQEKPSKLKKSRALFNQDIIDSLLQKEFKKVLPNYQFYGTNVTTPYLGPQIKADEFNGLCVTWSCMYMVLRLLNPDMSPSEVTIKMIDGTPEQLKNRVLRFQKYIIRTLSKEKSYIK